MTLVVFLLTTFSNMLASIIGGLIIGWIFSGILAKKIGKQLNDEERTKNNIEKKIEELEKTKNYLNTLDEMLKSNELSIKFRLEDLSVTKILNYKSVFSELSLWNVFVQSGELPKYLQPNLIKSLSNYFDWWENTKGIEIFITENYDEKPSTNSRITEKLDELKRCYQTLLLNNSSLRMSIMDNSGKNDCKLMSLRLNLATLDI